MQLRITKATNDEIAVLQQVGKQTFYETFADSNSETDMQQYLNEQFNTAQLQKELNTEGSSFFIAWEGDIPVGYLKLNTGNAQTDVHDDAAIEIERIYVKRDYLGKKVGQLLYEEALAIARLQQRAYIWLGVWELNTRAIRFYEKNGFVAFGTHIFTLGTDEQTDILMKKIL